MPTRTAMSLLNVTLAGEATVIRFVQVHLEDVRAIISVTHEMIRSPAAVGEA